MPLFTWDTSDPLLKLEKVEQNDDGTSRLYFTKTLSVEQSQDFLIFHNKQIDNLKAFDVKSAIEAKQAEINAEIDSMTTLVAPIQQKFQTQLDISLK